MVAMPAYANGYAHTAPLFNTPKVTVTDNISKATATISSNTTPLAVLPKQTLNPPVFIHDFVDEYKLKLTLLPSGWYAYDGPVTPELALRMLQWRDTEYQRKLNLDTVKQYQRDMESCGWEKTHQGLAFDFLGRLYDGQHRLEAGVRSHQTFNAFVWFTNAQKGAARNTDNFKPRTAADAGRFEGVSISPAFLAILRMANYHHGCQPDKMTHNEALQQCEKHGEAIDFVYKAGGSRVTKSALSACVRAWYHFQPSDVERFIKIVRQDVSATRNGDRAAVLLSKFISLNPGLGGQQIRNETFCKALRAIQAYMNGEKIERLYAADSSLFPLPADGKPRRK